MEFIKIQPGVYNIWQARFVFRKILVRFIQGFINKEHTQYSDYRQSCYTKHGQEYNRTKDFMTTQAILDCFHLCTVKGYRVRSNIAT